MVGKTNLTFISKGEGSDVQLIQKSYVTGLTGEIYKIEKINGKFFVFGEYVMMGDDIKSLDYMKRNGEYVDATHIVYSGSKYYMVKNSSTEKTEKIYSTNDFQEYEDIDPIQVMQIPQNRVFENRAGNYELKCVNNEALFLNSKGEIIFAYEIQWEDPQKGYKETETKAYIDNNLQKPLKESISFITCDKKSFLIEDMIFSDQKRCSVAGTYVSLPYKQYLHTYVNGYFFYIFGGYINGASGSYTEKIYCSRDGVNYKKIMDEKKGTLYAGDRKIQDNTILPINGKLAVIFSKSNERYLNIADTMTAVGADKNEEVDIFDNFEVTSWIEDDGKTYIGTNNGIIYEYQLDYSGTLQRPDVTIIKTLSAKQALKQALQYTDESVEKLKAYIESKMQETLFEKQENSTEVEGNENIS